MRRALVLARRGPAEDPNPQVGCVIIDPEGRIVSEGWHHGAGTPHAEVDALSRLPQEWRDRASELTAVVTLEPCNHTGRTGPCAVRLVETGIGAVAYPFDDPGAEAGGGAETLRAGGVAVLPGVLAAEARELLQPWLDRQSGVEPGEGSGSQTSAGSDTSTRSAIGSSRRPHVTVKWAQTLDGRAAAADGSSQWITGAMARTDVHRRRAEADTILVGTGTLLADDPALTARASDGELLVPAEQQPMPVVLGRRWIPADALIRRHPALAARGATEPIRFAGDDLTAHLAELHRLGSRRLFVEGGPTIAAAFLADGLVDEVLVYVAPALLGGPILALDDLGIPSMSGIIRLSDATIERLGDDLLIRARLDHSQLPTTAPEEGS
ncbi:MAG: dihydrofolate reductase family protein [Actinobacteria bacterium]|nr:dihydrofolate reductase family protein [Actinomycetota bacterium]